MTVVYFNRPDVIEDWIKKVSVRRTQSGAPAPPHTLSHTPLCTCVRVYGGRAPLHFGATHRNDTWSILKRSIVRLLEALRT